MARPRRNPEKTVRLVAFVDPETLTRLQAEAAARGLSVGALLDLGHHPPLAATRQEAVREMFPPDVVADLAKIAPKPHQYTSKGYGRMCTVCGHLEQRDDQTSCP